MPAEKGFLAWLRRLLGAPGRARGLSADELKAVKGFCRHLGVRVNNLELMRLALTHRSYLHVQPGEEPRESNERLEFLGDSVLGLVCSEWLYRNRPEEHEGMLTKTKSLLVSKAILSRRALAMGLGRFVLLSHSEVESGGRQRLSILADAFESVIGAIYLDQGLGAARQFVQTWLLNEATEIVADKRHTNYKSLLQEYVQSTFHTHPVYRIRHQHGPDHLKQFTVEVTVGGRTLGEGRGHNKKDAEQSAARNALDRVAAEAARRGEGRRGRSRGASPSGAAREAAVAGMSGADEREEVRRAGRDLRRERDLPEREHTEREERRPERAIRERPEREERRPERAIRERPEREERSPEPVGERRTEGSGERRAERRGERRRSRRGREDREGAGREAQPGPAPIGLGASTPPDDAIEAFVEAESGTQAAYATPADTAPRAEATYGRKGKPNVRGPRITPGLFPAVPVGGGSAAMAEAPAGTPTRHGPVAPAGEWTREPVPVPEARIVEGVGGTPPGAPEDRYRVAESDAPARPERGRKRDAASPPGSDPAQSERAPEHAQDFENADADS